MKAEGFTRYDLSYGDFVYYHGKIVKVISVMSNGYEFSVIDKKGEGYDVYDTKNDLKPIPITPEILRKNGFKKEESEFGDYYGYDECGLDCCIIFNYVGQKNVTYVGIFEPSSGTLSFNSIYIHYIHELQHTLRLCGINKEIVL